MIADPNFNASVLFKQSTPMDDERLLFYLKRRIMKLGKPGNNTKFPKGNHWSQMDESQVVDGMLNRTNGYFVECGASDGVTYSNSLYFEASKQWTGLLIEANRGMFQNLIKTERNVHAYHGCLSPNTYPQILRFKESNFLGGLAENYEGNRKNVMAQTGGTEVMVECVPLYSLLLALEVTHVDYFSLDTEGSELDILRTIPFFKIQIDVISVEWIIWGGSKEEQLDKKNKLKEFMAQTSLYQEAIEHRGDLFFKRKGL